MNQNIRKQIHDQAHNIPPLPEVVTRVLTLTESADASASEVARVVSMDQAMAARVLRLANSAHYGLPKQVSSVHQAVMVLGFSGLRQLILAAGLNSLTAGKFSGYFLGKGELWRHSMASASGADLLAEWVGFNREEAFTAGLMHDIGKLVLAKFLGSRYDLVRQFTCNEGKSFLEAERQLFETDHAEVGGLVAKEWNLPPALVQAIAVHHAPLESGNVDPLVCIVHLADAFALSLGQGLGLDGLNYVFYPEVLSRLGLSSQDLEILLANMTHICSKGFDF